MRQCIFCPNPANSREHIWADWLKEYVPRTQVNHGQARTWVHEDGRLTRDVEHRSGDPRSRKLKIVCTGCNNNWMSRIQERAKPILIPLIRGETCSLDADAQRVISGWAALLITIDEYTHRDWVSVSAAERAWIRRSGMAPPNWLIWAGRFVEPNGDSRMSRSVLPMVSNAELERLRGAEGPRVFNGQTSTFLAGQLLIHTLSTPRRLRFTLDPRLELKLRLICPPRRQVYWPPGTLDESDYNELTRAVRKRIWERSGRGSPA